MIIPFRRRSSKTLILAHERVIGLATLALVVISYLFIDRPLAESLESIPSSLFALGNLLTDLVEPRLSYVIWPLLYFFFRCVLKKERIAKIILLFIVAIPLAEVASGVIKWTCGRPRPELYLTQGLYGFEFFKLRNVFQSFPSGHATAAGVIGGLISCLKPKWTLPIMGAALFFGFTRVVIEQHFLSDVLAGVFIGGWIAQWTYTKMN